MNIKRAVFTSMILPVVLFSGSLSMAASKEIPVGGTPSFIYKSIRSTSIAMVSRVKTLENEDVVMLNGGVEKGFGVGMACEVFDNNGKIADIMLVDVRKDMSAGLILSLENKSIIKSGNIAKIKTLMVQE